MLSRTHPGLVKRLFEMEVPELYDGTVELKAISREAGSRTKIAVYSKDTKTWTRWGYTLAPKGARVAKIVDELGGEKSMWLSIRKTRLSLWRLPCLRRRWCQWM